MSADIEYDFVIDPLDGHVCSGCKRTGQGQHACIARGCACTCALPRDAYYDDDGSEVPL